MKCQGWLTDKCEHEAAYRVKWSYLSAPRISPNRILCSWCAIMAEHYFSDVERQQLVDTQFEWEPLTAEAQ